MRARLHARSNTYHLNIYSCHQMSSYMKERKNLISRCVCIITVWRVPITNAVHIKCNAMARQGKGHWWIANDNGSWSFSSMRLHIVIILNFVNRVYAQITKLSRKSKNHRIIKWTPENAFKMFQLFSVRLTTLNCNFKYMYKSFMECTLNENGKSWNCMNAKIAVYL